MGKCSWRVGEQIWGHARAGRRAPCLAALPLMGTRIGDGTGHLCGPVSVFYGTRGNQPSDAGIVVAVARNGSTSNAQRDRHLRGWALASAKIIPFAPYLARKRKQEVQCLLAAGSVIHR